MNKYEKLILIVDDVAYIRIQIKNILVSSGYKNVTFASNGIEAFKKISSLHPELILLDLFLPKINGIRLLSILKMLNYRYKILVISATDNMEVFESAMNNGALDWLQKPISSEILIEKVNKLMDLQLNKKTVNKTTLETTNDFSENIGIKLDSSKSLQILLLYGKFSEEEFYNLKETILALQRYNYKNVIVNLNGVGKINFSLEKICELRNCIEKNNGSFWIVVCPPMLRKEIISIGIPHVYKTEAEVLEYI